MSQPAFTSKQNSVQIVLKTFDRFAQRRLRDSVGSCRLREVEALCKVEKVLYAGPVHDLQAFERAVIFGMYIILRRVNAMDNTQRCGRILVVMFRSILIRIDPGNSVDTVGLSVRRPTEIFQTDNQSI